MFSRFLPPIVVEIREAIGTKSGNKVQTIILFLYTHIVRNKQQPKQTPNKKHLNRFLFLVPFSYIL